MGGRTSAGRTGAGRGREGKQEALAAALAETPGCHGGNASVPSRWGGRHKGKARARQSTHRMSCAHVTYLKTMFCRAASFAGAGPDGGIEWRRL